MAGLRTSSASMSCVRSGESGCLELEHREPSLHVAWMIAVVRALSSFGETISLGYHNLS
jgi:hypothetical protein